MRKPAKAAVVTVAHLAEVVMDRLERLIRQWPIAVAVALTAAVFMTMALGLVAVFWISLGQASLVVLAVWGLTLLSEG